MMVGIVGQHVAARAEWPPADLRLVQLENHGRRLRFSFRRDYPIDRSAYSQAGQVGKSPAAFSAHTESGRDVLERFIALLVFRVAVLLLIDPPLETSRSPLPSPRCRSNSSICSPTRCTVPAPSVITMSPD